MLILGIFLTVLGFIIFQWSMNAQSQPAYNRPLIFHKPVAIIIINLLWLILLLGGLYSLWQVNFIIVLSIVGIFALLWIVGFLLGSEKTRAKKIFKIYKQLKLFRPKANEDEILKETASTYFRGLRWDESKINMTIEAIFEKSIVSDDKDKDIKDLVSSILIFENPSNDYMSGYNFEKSMKQHSKKQKAIDDAYNAIIGGTTKATERPNLSKNTIDWIKSAGLNPEDMSNEQLAVFTEIDDHKKSNWAVRFLYGTSFIFLILAFFNLIGLDFMMLAINIVIAFVVWYIGHKIQMRRINKKFYEASIMKFAQEQAKAEDKKEE